MVALMKRESGYRKDMDTLQAMVDEANKNLEEIFKQKEQEILCL